MSLSYPKHRGQIDEQFGFLAFRTAPLVSAATMDAKVATSDMASRLMVWAAIGKPNQREWVAPRYGYSGNDGLFPSGYALFRGEPSDSLRAATAENEKARLAGKSDEKKPGEKKPDSYAERVWKGWVLPASDADTWFVAGASAYARVLRSEHVDQTMNVERAQYRGLKLIPQTAATRFHIEEGKGILFLDALRHKLGDDKFFALMKSFFDANTTKAVTAQSFLDKAGVPFDFAEPAAGPAYIASDINRWLDSAVLVYGTVKEAGANRYAAEQMQLRYFDRLETEVPIYKDFEVSDDILSHRNVIFVGRPEANSALAAWTEKLGLKYDGAVFEIDGQKHASEREALVWAATNPLDSKHMVLVVAGNDALRTVKSSRLDVGAEYAVFQDGEPLRTGFVGQGSVTAAAR